jgi:alkanesulfonate monooxygenase SsuD/methylene tetrahydromethanopterin reductase-like flavin-dependent oxidoreductase (luciferase family)
MHLHIFLAESDELAHARVAQSYPVYHQNLAHLWRLHNVPFPNRDSSFGGDMHAAIAAQDLVIGSSETVAAHIQKLVNAAGLEYLIMSFAWVGLTHAESMASVDLFARENLYGIDMRVGSLSSRVGAWRRN